ncbi:MAG: HAD-IA family hydrolase [Gammaproteobacteria bacterium]|nr:HAD-IA family hydrolase [Gammaproteobacteria bacterium]
MIKTVLFDLDGTLVDTAPDMAAALDQLCREQDQILLPFERVRPVVSDGSVALVELAFGNELEEEYLTYLKQRYLDIYAGKIAVHSKLFDGTRSVLDHLSREGMNWGVVTNKPAWLTEPLMEALGLKQLAACIVSGDTTAHSKPHPAPMFHACKLAGSTAAECLYVGDARRDIEAGNNAGMKTLIALYGYIGEDEDPRDWKAGHAINKPEEILQYLTAS